MTSNQPLFSLEDADLSNLLMPSWVKEGATKPSFSSALHDHEQRKGSISHKKSKHLRKPRKSHDGQERHSSSGHKEKYAFRKESRASLPVLQGWKILLLPEQHALDDIAKQIKSESKAYPLFELARLILAKPERNLRSNSVFLKSISLMFF